MPQKEQEDFFFVPTPLGYEVCRCLQCKKGRIKERLWLWWHYRGDVVNCFIVMTIGVAGGIAVGIVASLILKIL